MNSRPPSQKHFLSRSERSTLVTMSRSAKEHAADPHGATDSEWAEAASLAAKSSTLLPRLESRAGQITANTAQLNGRRAPRPSGLIGRVTYWLVCLITLSLVVVAGLRLFYHDGTHFLIWLNAFTRYVYLPAYACLAWAVWKRRWILVIANVALVSLHVALLAPDFMRDRRFDAFADGASMVASSTPTVRIFFANVRALNKEYTALLEEIRAANPDVIVLVEFSWFWLMAYHDSPFFAAYPYGGGMAFQQLGDVNVFSRIPLASSRKEWFGGRALRTIEIPVGAETLHVIGLHAPRPMNIQNSDYEGFWSRTIPIILAEKGPLVVVGDCNATQYSAVYKKLTADRLRSAHEDRGRGYATSWPNGQLPLPPIRIDQALVSREVECLDIKEGEGRGSDHKPLILDVTIRRNP
jgi:endonuclease/exonuclease/phosphatase (EEP) superfamily protein YafD